MIGYMGSQQRKQLEGLEELAMFTSRELKLFMDDSHPVLLEQVHQNVAKAALALKWLNEDISILNNSQEMLMFRTSILNISIEVC